MYKEEYVEETERDEFFLSKECEAEIWGFDGFAWMDEE